MDRWTASGDLRQSRRADAIRYYYMVGMSHDRINDQMTFEKLGAKLEVSRSSAERLCKEALDELRNRLAS